MHSFSLSWQQLFSAQPRPVLPSPLGGGSFPSPEDLSGPSTLSFHWPSCQCRCWRGSLRSFSPTSLLLQPLFLLTEPPCEMYSYVFLPSQASSCLDNGSEGQKGDLLQPGDLDSACQPQQSDLSLPCSWQEPGGHIYQLLPGGCIPFSPDGTCHPEFSHSPPKLLYPVPTHPSIPHSPTALKPT